MWQRILALSIALLVAAEASEVKLQVRALPDGFELSWSPPSGGLTGPAEFRVEESSDLSNWSLNTRVILAKGRSEPWRQEFGKGRPSAFFRIASRFDVSLVRVESADALGYDDTF